MLLRVRGLCTSFHTEAGVVQAVTGVDLDINEGETLGLVGESGCGKSVTALSILRLIQSPPGKIEAGEVIFRGEDLLRFPMKRMRKEIRGRKIAMVFQDPMTSLNPVVSVGYQVAEAIRIHQKLNKRDAKDRAVEMLEAVGISDAGQRFGQYPHQFSGGMRQRVMIAMALSCHPDLLIADEPTTALDVTIQAQILELLKELKGRFITAILLITHNLGLVADIADRVVVMYAGEVVEAGDLQSVFRRPKHPYTMALLQCFPDLSRERRELAPIEGTVPNLVSPPSGCRFHPRCQFRMEPCSRVHPDLEPVEPGHKVRCHLYDGRAS